MVKLQQSKKGSYHVVIPKDLVEMRNWKKGQKLALANNEKGRIEIFEI